MLRRIAILFVLVVGTSCTTAKLQGVSFRELGSRADVTDVAHIGWLSHSSDTAAISVVALLNAGETIPRESVWVHATDGKLTLCYSVVTSADDPMESRKVMIIARVSGIPRSDRRLVEASRNCGRTA